MLVYFVGYAVDSFLLFFPSVCVVHIVCFFLSTYRLYDFYGALPLSLFSLNECIVIRVSNKHNVIEECIFHFMSVWLLTYTLYESERKVFGELSFWVVELPLSLSSTLMQNTRAIMKWEIYFSIILCIFLKHWSLSSLVLSFVQMDCMCAGRNRWSCCFHGHLYIARVHL